MFLAQVGRALLRENTRAAVGPLSGCGVGVWLRFTELCWHSQIAIVRAVLWVAYNTSRLPTVVGSLRVFDRELTRACLCPGCPLLPRTDGQLPPAAEGAALVPPHGAGCRPSNGKGHAEGVWGGLCPVRDEYLLSLLIKLAALMLLRNKNLINPTSLLELFFQLLRCHDKLLRKVSCSYKNWTRLPLGFDLLNRVTQPCWTGVLHFLLMK